MKRVMGDEWTGKSIPRAPSTLSNGFVVLHRWSPNGWSDHRICPKRKIPVGMKPFASASPPPGHSPSANAKI